MRAFQVLLIIMLVVLTGYTLVTIANHGINLFSDFFGDMAEMAWPGQFNLDFMFMLTLSALWVSWRHEFTPAGLGLGVLAFFGGAFFLSIYLSVISRQVNGDVKALLVGPSRTA